MRISTCAVRLSAGALLAGFIMAIIPITASARDQRPKMHTKAPRLKPAPVAPVADDWSGLYLGGHAGYGWGSTGMLFPDTGVSLSPGTSGFVGGGQIGYQRQFGAWVLGVEVSLAGTGINGSGNSTGASCTVAVLDCRMTGINVLTMVDGRVGRAWGTWLLYASGGYAGARVSTDAVVVATGVVMAPDTVLA